MRVLSKIISSKVSILVVGLVLGMSLLTPASAHVGDTAAHLWTEHIKPLALDLFYTKGRLHNAGTINASGNPVDWTKLKDVPLGIADGRDAGKYARIIVVAKSGGDFTSPIAAMNSIKDASATKRYLIYIAPGVYFLGETPLNFKSYVDVTGAGQDATTLTGSNADGLLRLDDHPRSILKDLTVSSGGPTVHVSGDAQATLRQVTINGDSVALRSESWNYAKRPVIRIEDSIITSGLDGSAGFASIFASRSILTIVNSTVESSTVAIHNFSSNISIIGSTVKANGIYGDDATGIINRGSIGRVITRSSEIVGIGVGNGVTTADGYAMQAYPAEAEVSGSALFVGSDLIGSTLAIDNQNSSPGLIKISGGTVQGGVSSDAGSTLCNGVMSFEYLPWPPTAASGYEPYTQTADALSANCD